MNSPKTMTAAAPAKLEPVAKCPKTGAPLFSLQDTVPIVTNHAEEQALATANARLERIREVEQTILQSNAALGHLRKQLEDDAAAHISELRSLRMTIVQEVGQMLPALREIRTFFHGSDYSVQVQRLKEFVGLCEQLKSLQADGTLSAVSDVMIRLSVGQESEGVR